MWDNKSLVFHKCAWHSVSYVMWVVCWCVMCHVPGPYVVCEVSCAMYVPVVCHVSSATLMCSVLHVVCVVCWMCAV